MKLFKAELIVAQASVISSTKGIVKLMEDCDSRLVDTDVTYDMHRIQNNKLRRHFKENGAPVSNLVEIVFNLTPKGFRTIKKITNLETGSIFKGFGPSTVAAVMEETEKIVATTHEEVMDLLKEKLEDMSTPKVILSTMEKDYTTAPETVPAVVTKGKDKGLLNGYYISDDTRKVFTTAHKMSGSNPDKAVKIMMVGASGYGKTTVPKLFAQAAGMGFYRMNCATVRDPEEWFGYREAVEGSTKFFRSEFAKVIEAGNAVIVLDEFNRLEPWLHNTLFPLLDDDGKTVVHDEEFKIGPGVIVVGTINTGYKYTGTFELDEALLNRFEFIIEVGPMPKNEELKVLKARTGINKDAARTIIKAANDLRSLDVVSSTRTTLLVAQMVVSGLTVREAYQNSVVNRIPNDDSAYTLRKDVIDSLNMNCGTLEDKPLVEDIFAQTKTVVKEASKEESVQSLTFTIEPKGDDFAVEYVRLAKLVKRMGCTEEPSHTSVISLKDAASMAKEVQNGGCVKVTVPLTGFYVCSNQNLKHLIGDLKSAGVAGKVVKNM